MKKLESARLHRRGSSLRLLPAAWVCLMNAALPATVGDPSMLLQQGKFREAQSGFEAMAERQPTDHRWHYNAGVAAFRAGDSTTAQKHFEAATAASDLGLQQRAWYNLGHAWFEKATAPEAEGQEEALKKAAEAFGAALQLAPQDRIAKENLAAVQQFEEQLKQQQQQQEQDQQQDGQPDPKKDKGQKGKQGKQGKDGKQNSGKDSSDPAESEQGDSQSTKKSKQDQASKSKESEQKKSQGDPQKDDREDKPNGSERDQAKNATNAPAGGSRTNQPSQAKAGDKEKAAGDQSGIQRGEGSEPGGAEGESVQLAQQGERMTVQQAQQMLDAQKGSEKPIWTLVRGWGQENQQTPSSSNRRRNW